jgi:hypothetical protein
MAKRSEIDALFRTDESKEKDGVLCSFGTLNVWVARLGGANKQFERAWEEETRPYKALIDNQVNLPENVAREMTFRTFARGNVRSWDLQEDDGTPVPCDVEHVVAEFVRNPDLFRFLFQFARNIENYRRDVLETEAKN